MKERPILFSPPMVCAILGGKKTQTRRVVKQQPPETTIGVTTWYHPDPRAHFYAWTEDGKGEVELADDGWCKPCPYGQPGDRLWVREAWRVIDLANGFAPREITAAHRIWYEADVPHESPAGRYRPGMFMPRWASRIKLEITGVRVERLQDIREADAVAEGVSPANCCMRDDDTSALSRIGPVFGNSFPIARYAALWESINGHGSWEANQWVWVVEFKRIEN